MTFSEVKGLMAKQLSSYYTKRCDLMRKGKYTAGMQYNDGYVAMLFETINEIQEEDEYYPLSKAYTRRLIFAFNRLTGSYVPDVWEDSI